MATRLELLQQAVSNLQSALADPRPTDPSWCFKADALLADIRGLTGYGDCLVFPLQSNADPNITCLFCGEANCDLAATYQSTLRTKVAGIGRAFLGAHSRCAVHARLTIAWPSAEGDSATVVSLTRGLQASGEEARGLLEHLLESIEAREALAEERDALLRAAGAIEPMSPDDPRDGICLVERRRLDALRAAVASCGKAQ
jgi:hypothetical protein